MQVLNQKSAKRLLQQNGWTDTRGGKHAVKMEKRGCRPITLPRHKGRDYSKRPDRGDTEASWSRVRRRMAEITGDYTVRVRRQDDHYWAEVTELPGCFATGDTLDELAEALTESIALYLDLPADGAVVEGLTVDEMKLGPRRQATPA